MLTRWFCFCIVSLSLAITSLRAQPASVDGFYEYTVGIAHLAGYDTSTLPQNPSETFKTAVAAYMWGFPLETTYRSQLAFLNTHGLAVNTLYAPGVIDTSTTVEAPDMNVLYTSGFLDLSGTNAYVLTIPNTTATNTYNVMEIVNAYGATTSTVGTRNFTTSAVNNSGGNFLMVGPGYDSSQPLPAGVIGYIQSETAQSWLIGRMNVDNLATATLDGSPTPYNIIAGGESNPLSLGHSVPLAQAYAVTALADYTPGGSTTPAITSSSPTPEQEAIAEANSATKTGQDFYAYVGQSVAQNGVPSTASNDQMAMFQHFASIGLTTAGYTPPTDPQTIATMNQAAAAAAAMLQTMALNTSTLPGGGATSTGWTVNTSLGEYAADYDGWLTSALTSYIGTIANLAVDGTYPQTTISMNNGVATPLSGANSYTITFAAGELPPVEGFWSITIYDLEGNIVPNTGNTFYGDNVYQLGSAQLQNIYGASLDETPITFYLQSTAPTDESLMPFWLPVPDGEFEIILRMYFPSSTDPSILDGTYAIPAVQMVPEPSTYALLGLGALLALSLLRRRRQVAS